MRSGAIISALRIAAASACLFAAPAVAQDAGVAADPAAAPAVAADDDAANAPSETPLTPEEAAALRSALLFDPANLASSKQAKPLRLPGLNDPTKLDVSHNDKPGGASTMAINRPLASDWDAKVGANLNLATALSTGYLPSKPLAVTTASQDSGAAWASVGMANLATVDARIDPGNDQGKLGTTFKHSIPVGSKFSVMLQDSYSVTETFAAPAPAPSDVPLMAVPATTAPAPPTPQIWGSQKALKFDVLATGTTFGAGVVTASNDPVMHNTFSADQKLYGPLHVTTAVTDFGQTTASKSISAGLKLNW